MDLPLAANEIYLCSIANDYQRRVNSYPEAPLALLSPLLRCLCVFRINFEYRCTMLAHPFLALHHAYLVVLSQAFLIFVFVCIRHRAAFGAGDELQDSLRSSPQDVKKMLITS
jgi:hypothetical protein